MTSIGAEIKKNWEQLKQYVLLGVNTTPELHDAAEILEHGTIELIIVCGEIKYVNLLPKIKTSTENGR